MIKNQTDNLQHNKIGNQQQNNYFRNQNLKATIQENKAKMKMMMIKTIKIVKIMLKKKRKKKNKMRRMKNKIRIRAKILNN